MCQYHLEVCPYPHHDPIASTVLDFAKYGNWKLCNDPRPWGRLSCGNLSIYHYLPQLSSRHKFIDLDNDSEASEPPKLPPAIRQNDSPMPEITNLEWPESPPDPSSLSELATSNSSPPSPALSIVTTPEKQPRMIDESTSLSTKCEWCTIVLKAVSYKSIAIQNEAKKKMESLECAWDCDDDLRALYKDIEEKERQLYRLRQKAWVLANSKIVKK